MKNQLNELIFFCSNGCDDLITYNNTIKESNNNMVSFDESEFMPYNTEFISKKKNLLELSKFEFACTL